MHMNLLLAEMIKLTSRALPYRYKTSGEGKLCDLIWQRVLLVRI